MDLKEKRLVLRYEPGTYTFRHLAPGAGAEQLYALAGHLNAVQDAEARQALVVTVYRYESGAA